MKSTFLVQRDQALNLKMYRWGYLNSLTTHLLVM